MSRNKRAEPRVSTGSIVSRFVAAIRVASQRVQSEDRVEILECDDALVVVVADGAGGISGGATASEMVLEAVRRRTSERPFDAYNLRAWSDVLKHADEQLARNCGAGETTAIVVTVGPHGIAGVSAGDSEVWVVEDDRRADRLTEKQNRTRLGTGRSQPTTFHRRTMEGVLVAATDGLFRHASAQSIVTCCASADSAAAIADGLATLPTLRSGAYPDDVAVAVVRAASDGCR
jgi:PPM family protein phosphatase